MRTVARGESATTGTIGDAIPEVAAPPAAAPAPAGTVTAKSSPEEKVNFFLSLFRGREDVYAVRWEGRNGKAGYSPACRRAWGKPFPKHSEEPHEYFPLTGQVIHDHLMGKLTAGVYPLLADETCWFLAADFDKATWQEDVRAYLHTCSEWKVPALLERSRSGRGGHIWIFIAAPLPARLARKLGAAILTRTMERRHQLGLDSYDRFFPSQDTMPKGGFGHLIALPLQHVPRGHGNRVFLDANLNPHTDQWSLLSGVRKMEFGEVESVVREAERSGDISRIWASQRWQWLLRPATEPGVEMAGSEGARVAGPAIEMAGSDELPPGIEKAGFGLGSTIEPGVEMAGFESSCRYRLTVSL